MFCFLLFYYLLAAIYTFHHLLPTSHTYSIDTPCISFKIPMYVRIEGNKEHMQFIVSSKIPYAHIMEFVQRKKISTTNNIDTSHAIVLYCTTNYAVEILKLRFIIIKKQQQPLYSYKVNKQLIVVSFMDIIMVYFRSTKRTPNKKN